MDIHFHFTLDADATKSFFETIFLNNQKLDLIMATLADIQKQNNDLIAAVAAEDTAVDSAIVLIQGNTKALTDLKAQLDAAIKANDPTALQAVSDSMGNTITDVTAKTKALADAVVAGTPAAPQLPTQG
jgi:hypothetical protein